MLRAECYSPSMRVTQLGRLTHRPRKDEGNQIFADPGGRVGRPNYQDLASASSAILGLQIETPYGDGVID
jgi:hypothetical protein